MFSYLQQGEPKREKEKKESKQRLTSFEKIELCVPVLIPVFCFFYYLGCSIFVRPSVYLTL
jgi:hypothetical protein